MDDPFLRPWLDERVAYRYRTPRRAVGDRIPRNVEAAPIIAAAFNVKLPVFAAGGVHNAFEDFASRRVEHAICDLLSLYMRFEEQAIQTLLKYRLVRPYYWQFRVPPLPLEILRRCKSIEEVPYATLEVRHEHSGLRRQFAEMNGLISDPSVLPKRKIREVRKLESSLAAIGRVAEGEALVTFSNSGGYMLSGAVGGAQAIYGASSGDGAKGLKGGAELLKSAAAIAKMAMSDRFRAWRLEPLHRSIDRWMKTSDTEMIDQVSRLFGPPR